MAIIGGDQGKAGESKGSGRKADDLRLSCLCLLLRLLQGCSRHNEQESGRRERSTLLYSRPDGEALSKFGCFPFAPMLSRA